ncbi:hypothetical protein M9458_046799 [Cirrhinus mrigala]|uniref:Uncharacterized protein n=1 Tax=Cirrhinus mrigala TaxID=683832 RepID=A0ABD0N9H2_CIRMR
MCTELVSGVYQRGNQQQEKRAREQWLTEGHERRSAWKEEGTKAQRAPPSTQSFSPAPAPLPPQSVSPAPETQTPAPNPVTDAPPTPPAPVDSGNPTQARDTQPPIKKRSKTKKAPTAE